MYNIRPRSPYAGCVMKIRPEAGKCTVSGMQLGGAEIRIEDWFQNVSGCSWMSANGNPAALGYALRAGLSGGKIPWDNDVLYGKVDGLGYLVHVSELITEVA